MRNLCNDLEDNNPGKYEKVKENTKVTDECNAVGAKKVLKQLN